MNDRRTGAHVDAATPEPEAQRYPAKFGAEDLKAIDFGALRKHDAMAPAAREAGRE